MIETTFCIKQVSVDQALKQAEKKVKNTAEKIDKTLNKKDQKISFGDKVKNNLEQIKKGIESIGIGGDKLSKIGDVFSSGGGKLAILAAAVAVLGKQLVGIWDSLTLSAEQYKLKQQAILAQIKDKSQTENNQQKIDNSYLERLKELAEMQHTGNQGKKQAIALIQLLNNRYKDLGISINNVTGQIQGLQQAETKMLQSQQKRKLDNLNQELSIIRDQSYNQMSTAFVQVNKSFGSIFIDSFLFENFGLVKKGVNGALSDMLNYNLEDQIKILQQLRTQAKRKDQITALNEIIKLKKQELNLQKQINKLKNTGALSDQEYAKQLRDKTIKSKVIANQDRAGQFWGDLLSLERQRFILEDNAEFQNLNTDQERISFLRKKQSDQSSKIDDYRATLNSLKNKSYADDSEVLGDRKRISELDQIIERLEKKQKLTEKERFQLREAKKERSDLQTKVYSSSQERSEDLAQIARMQYNIAQAQFEQLKIQQKIDKLKKRSEKYYQDQNNTLQNQITIEQLLLQDKIDQAEYQKIVFDLKKQGLNIDQSQIKNLLAKKGILKDLQSKKEYKNIKQDLDNQLELARLQVTASKEQIERLRIINDLKKQGLNIDQGQISIIMQKKKELAGVQIQSAFTNEAQEILWQIYHKQGLGKTADIEKKIAQYENQYGVTLNDEQRKKIETLYNLQNKLDNMPQLKIDYTEKTNSLTARGGFASGGVFTDIAKINTQIKDYSAKTANILSQMKTIIVGAGLI